MKVKTMSRKKRGHLLPSQIFDLEIYEIKRSTMIISTFERHGTSCGQ